MATIEPRIEMQPAKRGCKAGEKMLTSWSSARWTKLRSESDHHQPRTAQRTMMNNQHDQQYQYILKYSIVYLHFRLQREVLFNCREFSRSQSKVFSSEKRGENDLLQGGARRVKHAFHGPPIIIPAASNTVMYECHVLPRILWEVGGDAEFAFFQPPSYKYREISPP